MTQGTETYMTLGDHLEELRRMLIRIIVVVVGCAAVVFCLKDWTFTLLLAPREPDFVTCRAIARMAGWLGMDVAMGAERVELISTELSAQFMAHLSTSVVLGLLVASPYVLWQLFGYVAPALYAAERRYAVPLLVSMYFLFMAGVAMTYFVLFPVALRFLGTYQVADSVRNVITLDSYISAFTSLTLVMGLVFQLPVVAWVLARLGVLQASLMRRYRRHALVALMVVAAVITPPDVFTLLLVTLPLYGLYELCILIVKHSYR